MGSAQITWERQQPFARLVQNLGETLRLTSPFLEFWLIDLHVCIYQYVLYMFLYVNMLFFTWSELVWSGYFATHRTKFVTFGSSHIFGETQIPVYIYICIYTCGSHPLHISSFWNIMFHLWIHMIMMIGCWNPWCSLERSEGHDQRQSQCKST